MKYFIILFTTLLMSTGAAAGGREAGGGEGRKTKIAFEKLLLEGASLEDRSEPEKEVYGYLESLYFEIRFLSKFYYESQKVLNPEDAVLQEMEGLQFTPTQIERAFDKIRCGARSNFGRSGRGCARADYDLRVQFRYDALPEGAAFYVTDDNAFLVGVVKVLEDRKNYDSRINVGTLFHELARLSGIKDDDNKISAPLFQRIWSFYDDYRFNPNRQRNLAIAALMACMNGPDDIHENHGYAVLSIFRLDGERLTNSIEPSENRVHADHRIKQCEKYFLDKTKTDNQRNK